MCLCVCAHVNAGYEIFGEGEPKDRRAVKLLTTEGDAGGGGGGRLHWGVFQCDTEV